MNLGMGNHNKDDCFTKESLVAICYVLSQKIKSMIQQSHSWYAAKGNENVTSMLTAALCMEVNAHGCLQVTDKEKVADMDNR